MSSRKKAKNKPLGDDEPEMDGDEGEEVPEQDPTADKKTRHAKADRLAVKKEEWRKIDEKKKSGKRRVDQLVSEVLLLFVFFKYL
jgi:hypothetical protein